MKKSSPIVCKPVTVANDSLGETENYSKQYFEDMKIFLPNKEKKI